MHSACVQFVDSQRILGGVTCVWSFTDLMIKRATSARVRITPRSIHCIILARYTGFSTAPFAFSHLSLAYLSPFSTMPITTSTDYKRKEL